MNQIIRRLDFSQNKPPRQEVGFADPMDFLTAELAKMGRMRPVQAAPTSAELITLPFCCSDNGQPFFVTLGKDRENEPYHIKSLERTYTRLLNAGGYRLGETASRQIQHHECDWTGFQCHHCGTGKCVGNAFDWIYCPRHEYAFCANRVEAIHGGGYKGRCPGCASWAMLTFSGDVSPLKGVGYSASKPNDHRKPSDSYAASPKSFPLLCSG